MSDNEISTIALRLLSERAEDSLQRQAASQENMRRLIACPDALTARIALDLQRRRKF